MKRIAILLCCLALALATPGTAQDSKPVSKVLITNANIFDGQNEKLAEGMSVLVEGNKIAKIAKSIEPPESATVIDAKGRTLMPGLIDAHWHSMFSFWPISISYSCTFYSQINLSKGLRS